MLSELLWINLFKSATRYLHRKNGNEGHNSEYLVDFMKETSRTHRFYLAVHSLGRDSADEEGSFDIQDAILWRDLTHELRTFKYFYQGYQATVNVDWSPIARRMVRLSHKGRLASARVTKVPISVTVDSEKRLDALVLDPDEIVKRFIYDTFLIANLCLPGSCDFNGAKLDNSDSIIDESYSLSAYDFDYIWQKSGKEDWHPFTILSAGEVVRWFSRLGTGVKQTAKTDIERALFSLLQLVSQDAGPTSIVWIWSAIESLYQGKKGISWSSLFDRIVLFLTPPTSEYGRLKKNLRLLFDLRSDVVHGRFQVFHPQMNERLDEDMDAEYGRVLDLYYFGIVIIIATIQTMILRNWTRLKFSEEVTGE